ncbi:MAG: hypothetical protein ACO34E_12980 [Limisphaerales bacterium]|jgi:hypothetical protein
MKTTVSPTVAPNGKQAASPSRPSRKRRVHPIIIYPYQQPRSYDNLQHLYDLVAKLKDNPATYATPVTVVDCKTLESNQGHKAFNTFHQQTVQQCSHVIHAWCVDTCQMWYTGLGHAAQQGQPGDVYWIIPGDFDYGSHTGKAVLSQLHDLPEICQELQQDICVGEIATDHSHSKQLIDTYGTFALLYNWFPAEGREIRQYTERPRSEFIALHHDFLCQMLQQRWYAYEQTVVLLLQAVFARRRISRFFVGHVSDLPQGSDSLSSALQQIERTERVLKSVWRERHEKQAGWIDRYRTLESQSDQIVRAASVILQNLLG